MKVKRTFIGPQKDNLLSYNSKEEDSHSQSPYHEFGAAL